MEDVKETNEVATPVRNYKDSVFRMLFSEKERLLSLYNALNGTDYTDPDELEINYCIENDILADFLTARRAEVMSMSIFEYNQEAHLRQVAEENRADGWEEGRKIGHREGRIEGTRILIDKYMKKNSSTIEEALVYFDIPQEEWALYLCE